MFYFKKIYRYFMSPICLDVNGIFPGLGANQVKDPAFIRMVRQLTAEAVNLFRQGRYSEFDGPVGNFGCQSLALYLLGLARSPVFRKEANALFGRLYLAGSEDGRHVSLPRSAITVSEEMANLIRCRLLSIASETATEDNIQGELRCDDKKIRDTFGISRELAGRVINISKERLAADTIAYTQNETDKVRSLPEKERALLQKMVGKIVVLPSQGGTLLTFASTSSTLKTVLRRIMETGAVVALKKLTVSQNAPPPLYYRFDPEERRFCELDPETLDPMEPVALIEATFKNNALDSDDGRDAVRLRINRFGLDRIILACGAQSPQFVPGRPDIFPRLKNYSEEVAFKLAEAERRQLIVEADAMECTLDSSPFIDPNHLSLSSVREQQRMATLEMERT